MHKIAPRTARTSRLKATGLLAALFLLTGVVAVAGGRRQEEVRTTVNDLLTVDEKSRDHIVDELLQPRKILIEELIPIVDPANRDKYSDETKSAAGYALGELRAVEAVPRLAEALKYEPEKRWLTRISRYDSPYVVALIKIGRPAVPAMIANIEQSDDHTIRARSLGVLNLVVGGKRRLLELLRKVGGRATDPEARERIQRAAVWAEERFVEDEEPLY